MFVQFENVFIVTYSINVIKMANLTYFHTIKKLHRIIVNYYQIQYKTRTAIKYNKKKMHSRFIKE